MKSDLAIAALIRSRMTELGLSRGEFAKRLRYKNIAKGIRRIDALCDGDLEGTKQFLDVLPQALETSAETVKLALEQTVRELELAEKQEAEARDKIWRENFCPHAVILTERTVPSPIFVAAIIGVEKLLRIDLDPTQGPVSFVRQVLDRLPEGVPAFGKPIGFVINYSPDNVCLSAFGEMMGRFRDARAVMAAFMLSGAISQILSRSRLDRSLTAKGIAAIIKLLQRGRRVNHRKFGITRHHNNPLASL